MAIVLQCDCGKTLKVSDDFAGKKARCPGCKAVLDIPAADGDEEAVVAKPKQRARDDDDDDDRPRSKKAARNDDDDDDEPRAKKAARDDDEDRPRKKKKKGSKKLLLILLLGGGAVALVFFAVVGYAALAYFIGLWPFGGGLGAEMKWVPDGCKHIRSERVAHARASKVWKSIESELSADDKKNMSKQYDRLGLSIEDIERETHASDKEGKGVTIITTNKSLKASDIASKKGSAEGGTKYKETKVGSYTMYEPDTGSGPGGPGRGFGGAMAFAVPDSKIYIEGPRDLIEAVLKRDKKPDLPEGMKKAMDLVSFSNDSASASDTSDRGSGPDKDVIARASETELGSDVTEKSITLCKDSKAADDKKQEAEVEYKKRKKDFDEHKKADDYFPETKFSTSGSKVIATTTIPGSEFKKFFKKGGNIPID
jgi:hypothetical protein